MKDKYLRQIDYLRISVTDRCNLRCTYCMPAEGIQPKSHEEILSIEEIVRLVKILAPLGIRKIRLTGGEPLVRKNVLTLVARLREIKEIEEISMTSNGILLEKMAPALARAGLDRVNISLDTLDAAKFHKISRVGHLSDVLAGIRAAQAADLKPIKLNVVAIRAFNDDEVGNFVDFAKKEGLHVRFIELMPMGEASQSSQEGLAMADLLSIIKEEEGLAPLAHSRRGGPSQDYEILGSSARIGVIAALSNHFCSQCNRMRLTADGKFRPCLYSSREFDVRALLRAKASDQAIRDLYLKSLSLKPKEHHMLEEAYEKTDRRMSQIGG